MTNPSCSFRLRAVLAAILAAASGAGVPAARADGGDPTREGKGVSDSSVADVAADEARGPSGSADGNARDGGQERDEEGSGEVVTDPVRVHASDHAEGPAGGAPNPADVERALDEPAFATVVRVADRPAEAMPVAEVLAESIGVGIRSWGGLGAFASISVRGAPAGQTEILVDGVPLSRVAFSSLDLGALELGTFERVEVFRGGVPVGLGGAALGGAVNFVTSVGPVGGGRRNQVIVGGGSFGARRLRLVRRDLFGGGQRAFRSTVVFGYAGADGVYRYFDDGGTPLSPNDDAFAVRSNNGYDQLDGVVRLRSGSPARRLEVGERVSFKRQGVPGAAGVAAERTSLDTLRNLLDVDLLFGGALGHPRLDLGARGHALVERQVFRDPGGELGLAGPPELHYLTLAGGGTLHGRYAPSDQQLWTLALEGRIEDFAETGGAAGPVLSGGDAPGASGRRVGGALSLADEVALGEGDRLVLVPAARVDVLWTRADDGSASAAARTDLYLSPRLAARLRIGTRVSLKGSYGRYFRAPTLYELYGDRGFLLGNPDLDPETGDAGDLGVVVAGASRGGSLDRLYLEAALFASRPRNLIVFLPTSGLTVRARNLSDALLWGAELGGSGRLFRALSLTGNYTLLLSEQQSELVSFDGKRVPGRPLHELYVCADVTRPFGARGIEVALFGDVTLVSGTYLDAGNTQKLPPRRFVGLGVRVEPVPGLYASVEVKNLFDQRTELVATGRTLVRRAVSDVLGYPLPGRAFYAAVDWSF